MFVVLRREGEREPHEETPTIDQAHVAQTPVVRVTQTATEMLARPSPFPSPSSVKDEPLEGSIEARRNQGEMR
jgi:hypothetical protein